MIMLMAKRFRDCNLDQSYLLPPSPHDWLPERHLARFLAEVVGELNLRGFYAHYEEGDGRGLAAYDPEMMTRLLLYAYCVGKRSSRQIEKATSEDIAFRYLAAGQQPDHDTIASFRRTHLEALAELFGQVLQLCREAGLVKLGQVAIDGTKMQANASPARTVRYRQLEQSEQELRERVRRILEEAAAVDEREDACYGRGKSEQDLPEGLADAEQRLKLIREAKAKLERDAAEKAARARQERESHGGKHASQASKKRYQRATAGLSQANPQHNFTDADSKIMKESSTGGFLQAYNAQIAVAEGTQIIVAAEVSNETSDRSLLTPMVMAVERELRQQPVTILADAGYYSSEALDLLEERGYQCLVSPDGQLTRQGVTAPGHNWPKQTWAVRMRERLRSEEGRRLYRLRQILVEPVFGQLKAARGIRSFLLRSLPKVRAEWRMLCLTHNLLKLYRQQCRA